MEGMTDWNKLTMEQYIEHLEEKFMFDSNGTAKAVFELINAYKALLIQRVTFCLPIEGDTFEKWFDKHFTMLGNTMVEAKMQPTIKYNQEDILQLWSFLNDRWLAN